MITESMRGPEFFFEEPVQQLRATSFQNGVEPGRLFPSERAITLINRSNFGSMDFGMRTRRVTARIALRLVACQENAVREPRLNRRFPAIRRTVPMEKTGESRQRPQRFVSDGSRLPSVTDILCASSYRLRHGKPQQPSNQGHAGATGQRPLSMRSIIN
jgi:hypothetical protein